MHHYQHSSTVNTNTDMRYLTEELLRENAFIKKTVRKSYSAGMENTIEQAVDLFGVGCKCIAGDACIDVYKATMLRQMRSDLGDEEMEDIDMIMAVETDNYYNNDVVN